MNLLNGDIIDPRHSSNARDFYYLAKDLRMTARQKEKHGDISPAILDQWKLIHQHLTKLFAMGCADLELCSWLTECALRLEGFSGLEYAFNFICQLAKLHGTNLSSVEQATESPHYWIAPISELSGETGEGLLIQPLRLCPLVPHYKYGEHCLWHYQSSIQDRESETYHALSRSVCNAGHTVMLQQRDTVLTCIAAYQALLAQLETMLPEHSPASANLLAVLQGCVHAINDLAGLQEIPEPSLSTITETDIPLMEPITVSTGTVSTGLIIKNREQALQLLGDIALFFRHQEPQSPIAPALETLIRRGRLPFAALLEDLLGDEDTRRTIITNAGIHFANREDP